MSDTQFNTTRATRERIELDEQQRLERYKRAWTAYYGNHPLPLKPKPGKADNNVIVNYSRLIVDVGVSFLIGEPDNKGEVKSVTFSIGADDSDTSDAEAWLRLAWRRNRKMTTLNKIALNGAVCGNTYVKLMENGDYPRLIVLDPATVTPVWHPDDIERLIKVVVQYEATDPATMKEIEYRQTFTDMDGDWLIVDEQRSAGAQTWATIRTERWGYDWCPVHHCQNLPDANVFWGMADLEPDTIALNYASNMALSNINQILHYHGHPKNWGRGFRATDMDIAVDGTIILPNADASLNTISPVDDLSSFLDYAAKLRASLRETTHTPEVALGGIDDASRVSSLALKVLYGPILMHTGRKRATYGEMLQELNAHMLEMGGFGANLQTFNEWPFVLPEDPYQEAQTLLIDQQLGASKETTLRARGYNPAVEAENRSEEGESLGAQLLRAFDRGDEDA